MPNKYNPKDKFTAKENDFVIVSMPPKKQEPKKSTDKKQPKKK